MRRGEVVSVAEYRKREFQAMSEKEFQDTVIKDAKVLGWMTYHTFDSRRSEWGWPDLVLVHPTRENAPIIIAELKSETGRVRPAQRAWLAALEARSDGVTVLVRLWRPSDMPEIQDLLAGNSEARNSRG